MRLGRINHVGVATPSLAAACRYWQEVMGAPPPGAPIELPAQGVRVCFVDLPDGQVELLEPLGVDSPIARFLQRNPAGGQHHLCYEVADIAAAEGWFRDRGAAPLAPPRIGAHGTPVFFLHPRNMGGVLTEIMERRRDDH